MRLLSREARWGVTTIVHLRLGSLRGPLNLERTPRYLRFVIQGAKWETLDALDQPVDSPDGGEKCYAAIRTESSSVHVDGYRNGKRFGEWHKTATYELVADQPSQEQMADYEQWKAWCMLQLDRGGGE